MRIFYDNLLKVVAKLREMDIPVILNANIPASEENEKDGENYWRILHMNDINDLYKKASEECQVPMISLYDAFTDYCKKENVTVDSMLADGLHPNDKGYEVIFHLMLQELELV
jgi:lysophospholipase L1-like esterase